MRLPLHTVTQPSTVACLLLLLRQVAAVQSLSGTGSCRLFAEYQKRFLPGSAIYIPVVGVFQHVDIGKHNMPA